MPNMEPILLVAVGSTFFGEADLVHACFQILFDPGDAHIHTFWGADGHSLYEPTRPMQGFKTFAYVYKCTKQSLTIR